MRVYFKTLGNRKLKDGMRFFQGLKKNVVRLKCHWRIFFFLILYINTL